MFLADSRGGEMTIQKDHALGIVKRSLWLEKVKATGHVVIEEVQRG